MNELATLCLWQNPTRNGCSAWRKSGIADIRVKAKPVLHCSLVVQVIADMGRPILLSSRGSLVSQCLQIKLLIYKYSIANTFHPTHGTNALESASARSTTQ